MPQRLHDARVSIAHGREVAARANIGHRKLRPREVLQNRPEDDERSRVVQLAVRCIGDDADHFDVTTLRVRRAECAGRQRRLRGTARARGTPRPAPRRASPGRRPTRCRAPADAGVGTNRRSRATRTPVSTVTSERRDAVGPRVVIIGRERPREPEVGRVIHRQRRRIGPRHAGKVGDERPVVIRRQQLHDLRARETRG